MLVHVHRTNSACDSTRADHVRFQVHVQYQKSYQLDALCRGTTTLLKVLPRASPQLYTHSAGCRPLEISTTNVRPPRQSAIPRLEDMKYTRRVQCPVVSPEVLSFSRDFRCTYEASHITWSSLPHYPSLSYWFS